MTYFLKAKKEEFNNALPEVLLPIISKNLVNSNGDLIGLYVSKTKDNNFIGYELPFSTYLACWRLANLVVFDVIEEKLSYEREEMKLSHNFSTDLAADSLDLVEIAIYLEKITNIKVSEKVKFKTLSDLIDYIFTIMILRVKKELTIWPTLNSTLSY
jgi:acyl carrier protein